MIDIVDPVIPESKSAKKHKLKERNNQQRQTEKEEGRTYSPGAYVQLQASPPQPPSKQTPRRSPPVSSNNTANSLPRSPEETAAAVSEAIKFVTTKTRIEGSQSPSNQFPPTSGLQPTAKKRAAALRERTRRPTRSSASTHATAPTSSAPVSSTPTPPACSTPTATTCGTPTTSAFSAPSTPPCSADHSTGSSLGDTSLVQTEKRTEDSGKRWKGKAKVNNAACTATPSKINLATATLPKEGRLPVGSQFLTPERPAFGSPLRLATSSLTPSSLPSASFSKTSKSSPAKRRKRDVVLATPIQKKDSPIISKSGLNAKDKIEVTNFYSCTCYFFF